MKQADTGPAGAVETDQVTDQVAALIRVIGTDELGSSDLMQALGLSHRPTFRNNYLNPSLEGGWIERTQPDSPRSPTQCFKTLHDLQVMTAALANNFRICLCPTWLFKMV
jgi:hypothetical protein